MHLHHSVWLVTGDCHRLCVRTKPDIHDTEPIGVEPEHCQCVGQRIDSLGCRIPVVCRGFQGSDALQDVVGSWVIYMFRGHRGDAVQH
jgi:hypothetical protein